jgi:hypothetical protein
LRKSHTALHLKTAEMMLDRAVPKQSGSAGARPSDSGVHTLRIEFVDPETKSEKSDGRVIDASFEVTFPPSGSGNDNNGA